MEYNFEIDTAVFLSFILDLVKKFEVRFQDFAEIVKFFLFLKSPYVDKLVAQWTGVIAIFVSLKKTLNSNGHTTSNGLSKRYFFANV